VICDFKLFKEAMNKDEFNNRPLQGALSDFAFKVSSFSSLFYQTFQVVVAIFVIKHICLYPPFSPLSYVWR
jgi:hypothetical protein